MNGDEGERWSAHADRYESMSKGCWQALLPEDGVVSEGDFRGARAFRQSLAAFVKGGPASVPVGR